MPKTKIKRCKFCNTGEDLRYSWTEDDLRVYSCEECFEREMGGFVEYPEEGRYRNRIRPSGFSA